MRLHVQPSVSYLQVLIDSSAVKAHRCASGVKGGSRTKPSAAREAIEAIGARLLYLPPHSPEEKDRVIDFNPTEPAFAKLKTLIRVTRACTVLDPWDTIWQAFTSLTVLKTLACEAMR